VVEDGCLLVVSKKTPEELLKFIGKKPYHYRLAILDGDASLAGLWVNKDDLTHERILGGIAAIDPALISIEAVEGYLMDKTKQKHRAEAARAAYESLRQEAMPPRVRTVTPEDGINWMHEIPVLPKWFEMQEGAVVPAVKRGFEIGPRGQNRNPGFKRGTTKTQRPVVRFDLCTKCTLCWAECPDECFDPTTDGFYDVDYQYCVGCGKCAQVCPVKECIVMVDELQFEDDSSPWEHWKKDPPDYIHWAENKKGKERVSYPVVTGKGMIVTPGEVMPEGKIVPVRKTEEVEV
jgi:pyruvate ferredoxin oxidoreductase delta subunit